MNSDCVDSKYMVVREYPGGRKLGYPFGVRSEADLKFAKEARNHPLCRIHLIDREVMVSLDCSTPDDWRKVGAE